MINIIFIVVVITLFASYIAIYCQCNDRHIQLTISWNAPPLPLPPSLSLLFSTSLPFHSSVPTTSSSSRFHVHFNSSSLLSPSMYLL